MNKLIVFDLDGVIYRGNKLLPYTKETLKFLKKKNYKIFYLTNNSTKTREQYKEKLNHLGIEVEKSEIMTSAYGTALYFKEKKIEKANIFVVGGEGIKKELENIGQNVFENFNNSKTKIDYVVVGLDFNFNFNKLYRAQQAILNGAKFIATNCDATYPTESGIMPGGGSIVKAIEFASGVKPLVIGKPNLYMLKTILKITNISHQNTYLVGDRIETDILLGKKLKVKTFLVLTGVTKKEDLKNVKKEYMPDYIIENLKELKKYLG
jgi:4-nitrophenyl phosphatase